MAFMALLHVCTAGSLWDALSPGPTAIPSSLGIHVCHHAVTSAVLCCPLGVLLFKHWVGAVSLELLFCQNGLSPNSTSQPGAFLPSSFIPV